MLISKLNRITIYAIFSAFFINTSLSQEMDINKIEKKYNDKILSATDTLIAYVDFYKQIPEGSTDFYKFLMAYRIHLPLFTDMDLYNIKNVSIDSQFKDPLSFIDEISVRPEIQQSPYWQFYLEFYRLISFCDKNLFDEDLIVLHRIMSWRPEDIETNVPGRGVYGFYSFDYSDVNKIQIRCKESFVKSKIRYEYVQFLTDNKRCYDCTNIDKRYPEFLHSAKTTLYKMAVDNKYRVLIDHIISVQEEYDHLEWKHCKLRIP